MFGLPSPALYTVSADMPFLISSLAVPSVATILKPSSLNALAIEIILNLSSLLTEIKTKPDSGNFIPALKVAL